MIFKKYDSYSYSAIKVLKYDYRKINIVYENNKPNQLE